MTCLCYYQVTGSGVGREDNKQNIYLYNIDTDPKEEDNLCERFPGIVEHMIGRQEYYELGMVSSQFPNIDINANPELHGGFWQPWIETNMKVRGVDYVFENTN